MVKEEQYMWLTGNGFEEITAIVDDIVEPFNVTTGTH